MKESRWRGGFTAYTCISPVSGLFPTVGSGRRGPRSGRGRCQRRRRRKRYWAKGGFIENLPSPRCHGAVWEEMEGRSRRRLRGGRSWGGRLMLAESARGLTHRWWGQRWLCCDEKRVKQTQVTVCLSGLVMNLMQITIYHIRSQTQSWIVLSESPTFGAHLFFYCVLSQ